MKKGMNLRNSWKRGGRWAARRNELKVSRMMTPENLTMRETMLRSLLNARQKGAAPPNSDRAVVNLMMDWLIIREEIGDV